MGITRRLSGRIARGVANSGVVQSVAGAAGDALEQSGAGGRAGRALADSLRNPEHLGHVADIATGLAVPGVRNKFRAANSARKLAQGVHGNLRGGGGAVSSDQFGGMMPPPPGSMPPPQVGGGSPSWMGAQPSDSDHGFDEPPVWNL